MRVTATAKHRWGDTYRISGKPLKHNDIKILSDGEISFLATMGSFSNSNAAEYTGTFVFGLDELRMILDKAREVEAESLEDRLGVLESKIDKIAQNIEAASETEDSEAE